MCNPTAHVRQDFFGQSAFGLHIIQVRVKKFAFKGKNNWADNSCKGHTTFLSSWTNDPGCFRCEGQTLI